MRERFFAYGFVPFPWRFCARAVGDRVEFKVWSRAEGEPGWGDPAHSDGITLPEGWQGAGPGRLVRRPPGRRRPRRPRRHVDLGLPIPAVDDPAPPALSEGRPGRARRVRGRSAPRHRHLGPGERRDASSSSNHPSGTGTRRGPLVWPRTVRSEPGVEPEVRVEPVEQDVELAPRRRPATAGVGPGRRPGSRPGTSRCACGRRGCRARGPAPPPAGRRGGAARPPPRPAPGGVARAGRRRHRPGRGTATAGPGTPVRSRRRRTRSRPASAARRRPRGCRRCPGPGWSSPTSFSRAMARQSAWPE